MHSTFALAIVLFTVASLSAPSTRAYEQKFSLGVTSDDDSGLYEDLLSACHSGAAIEALCVSGTFGSSFAFNESEPSPMVADDFSRGYLVWTLPSQPTPYDYPLEFYKNQTSNVNAGFFGIGNGPVQLVFNSKGHLGYDVTPTETQFTWFVCPQTYLGYQYPTVSFVNVFETPDNEDCAPVTIQRVTVLR